MFINKLYSKKAKKDIKRETNNARQKKIILRERKRKRERESERKSKGKEEDNYEKLRFFRKSFYK